MPEFIDATSITTMVATATTGLIVWFIQEARKTRALGRKQNDFLTSAILVLLRSQLVATHRSAIERSKISIAERQSFFETHQLYTSLGGNGPTTYLIDDIKRLHVVAD